MYTVYHGLSVVIHHQAVKYIVAVQEKTAVWIPGVSENGRHSSCSPGLATPSPTSVHGSVLATLGTQPSWSCSANPPLDCRTVVLWSSQHIEEADLTSDNHDLWLYVTSTCTNMLLFCITSDRKRAINLLIALVLRRS